MSKTARETPVRRALREDSTLQSSVKRGLRAVEPRDHGYFDRGIRRDFADSLNLEKAMRRGRDAENHWDYLLGHTPSGKVVAVEPHSATGHISTVIDKCKAARKQLQEHLRDGESVTKWLWVAAGKVHFAPTENAHVRLDKHGIELVGRRIQARHLPDSTASSSTAAERRRRKPRARR